MAIEANGRCPYAPASAVLEVLRRYRQHGLQAPFTADVLMRAGVSESVVPRTLQALRLLDLIDESDQPTEQLEAIARAPEEQYQAVMAEAVRAAYAEVFQFVDPANETEARIRDAFRSYLPRGQRDRMVTLFLRLCEEAGIREASEPAPRAATRSSQRRPARQKQPKKRHHAASLQGLPPALAGLLAEIPDPAIGWTAERRGSFLKTLQTVLDFSIPVVEPEEPTEEG